MPAMTDLSEVMNFRVLDASGALHSYVPSEDKAKEVCCEVVCSRYEKLTMPEPLHCLLARDARNRELAERERSQRAADEAAITQVTRNTTGPCMRVSRDGREVTVEVPAGTLVRVSNADTGETSEVRT